MLNLEQEISRLLGNIPGDINIPTTDRAIVDHLQRTMYQHNRPNPEEPSELPLFFITGLRNDLRTPNPKLNLFLDRPYPLSTVIYDFIDNYRALGLPTPLISGFSKRAGGLYWACQNFSLSETSGYANEYNKHAKNLYRYRQTTIERDEEDLEKIYFQGGNQEIFYRARKKTKFQVMIKPTDRVVQSLYGIADLTPTVLLEAYLLQVLSRQIPYDR